MSKIGTDKNIGKDTRFPNNDPTKGGAPKGRRITTIIKELLDTDVSKFSKKLKGLSTNEAIAVELISIVFHEEADNKDKMNAIKEILDRTEGKPKQEVEQTNIDKTPIFPDNPLNDR